MNQDSRGRCSITKGAARAGPALLSHVDNRPQEVRKRQHFYGGARGSQDHELHASALAMPPGAKQCNGPRGAKEGDLGEVNEN